MKKEKCCGAVVYDEGKVLIIKNVRDFYAFPKGHVDGEETEEETAYREVLEETGIETQIDSSFRYVATYSPREGILKDVVYFVGKPIGGSLKPQEGETALAFWVPLDEILDTVTFDNDKKMFEEAKKYILNKKS